MNIKGLDRRSVQPTLRGLSAESRIGTRTGSREQVAGRCRQHGGQGQIKAQGFTLLQMVIVITVMAIMTKLAIVRMPSVTFFQSYGFSNTLLYDLNLTKVLSMSQNQRYRLIIGTSSYQIQNQNGVAIQHPETTSTNISYPSGVSVSPETTVIFDSLGQPYNAAGTAALTSTLSITVSSAGGSQIISISPQTGFIQ